MLWHHQVLCDGDCEVNIEDSMPPAGRHKDGLTCTLPSFHRPQCLQIQVRIDVQPPICDRSLLLVLIRSTYDCRISVWRKAYPPLATGDQCIPGASEFGINVHVCASSSATHNHMPELRVERTCGVVRGIEVLFEGLRNLKVLQQDSPWTSEVMVKSIERVVRLVRLRILHVQGQRQPDLSRSSKAFQQRRNLRDTQWHGSSRLQKSTG
mmetsp:Transcript_5189/g.12485  ORF Transcript_5189/g.12485 Transcript_5189/m.12485 type:complete len:209 (-) Transcript_5189:446-1072(-)